MVFYAWLYRKQFKNPVDPFHRLLQACITLYQFLNSRNDHKTYSCNKAGEFTRSDFLSYNHIATQSNHHSESHGINEFTRTCIKCLCLDYLHPFSEESFTDIMDFTAFFSLHLKCFHNSNTSEHFSQGIRKVGEVFQASF